MTCVAPPRVGQIFKTGGKSIHPNLQIIGEFLSRFASAKQLLTIHMRFSCLVKLSRLAVTSIARNRRLKVVEKRPGSGRHLSMRNVVCMKTRPGRGPVRQHDFE